MSPSFGNRGSANRPARRRLGGILLHVTSLPGPYGVGDLGPEAHRFIDWLKEAGCALWQVLPLSPAGYGFSPYQSPSAFAGNPILISPDVLYEMGVVRRIDLKGHPRFRTATADYIKAAAWKHRLFRRAFDSFTSKPPATMAEEFHAFKLENAAWLADYSLFVALKDRLPGAAWTQWFEPLRRRDPAALGQARAKLRADIEFIDFQQFLFAQQWRRVAAHAKDRGVQIMGDVPIYVSLDSADAWSRPELFLLDDELRAPLVAGVPADGFSEAGQLWGNPLYDWPEHARSGFSWWRERIRFGLNLFQLLRLDHFRGFAGYYGRPPNGPVDQGAWVIGPGADLLRAIDATLREMGIETEGDPPLIAEDLGFITPDVIELRESFRLTRMKVLSLSFADRLDPFEEAASASRCAIYTGTHDTNTAAGWLLEATPLQRDFALRYLQSAGDDFAWDMIRCAWASTAEFAVTQAQDVLRLGPGARMNVPGNPEGNWEWRLQAGSLGSDQARELRALSDRYGRTPGRPPKGRSAAPPKSGGS